MAPYLRSRIALKIVTWILFCVASIQTFDAYGAEVDFDLSGIFNGDAIINYNAGAIDTTQDPTDVSGNTFLTDSAAQSFGAAPGNGLPDNGFFPANADHPNIQLGYSNDSNALNAWQTASLGEILYLTPPVIGRYSDLHLFFSASASCPIHVTLQYLDSTFSTPTQYLVPAWDSGAAPTTPIYTLFGGCDYAAVNGTGYVNATPPAQQLYGLKITPDSTRVLHSIKIERDVSSSRLSIFGAHGTTVANATFSHVWTGAAGDGLLTTAGNWQRFERRSNRERWRDL